MTKVYLVVSALILLALLFGPMVSIDSNTHSVAISWNSGPMLTILQWTGGPGGWTGGPGGWTGGPGGWTGGPGGWTGGPGGWTGGPGGWTGGPGGWTG